MPTTIKCDQFRKAITAHREAIDAIESLELTVRNLGEAMCACLEFGNKVLLFGNGGSAGDAQHIAAELTGRFVTERRGLPAIALTTDSSALTAIANDYGYDMVFARQVEALATRGDLVLGISTSGNSANVIKGLEVALAQGCTAWGFSGRSGGAMSALLGEQNLVVPVQETARIQECHILLGHILCALVDDHFAAIEGRG